MKSEDSSTAWTRPQISEFRFPRIRGRALFGTRQPSTHETDEARVKSEPLPGGEICLDEGEPHAQTRLEWNDQFWNGLDTH